ncbi:MAG TPA: 3-dehydroquinate dehydratase, partial [Deltaproteobacteria bacterium]|nr:3-dehydroquinate dehydratase [Deltaproteobacteria bacterium]
MNIGKLKLGNTPRIAAVILDGEDKKAIAAAKRDGADLLELRIDCFKRQDTDYIRKIIKDVRTEKLPVIATIRSEAE